MELVTTLYEVADAEVCDRLEFFDLDEVFELILLLPGKSSMIKTLGMFNKVTHSYHVPGFKIDPFLGDLTDEGLGDWRCWCSGSVDDLEGEKIDSNARRLSVSRVVQYRIGT